MSQRVDESVAIADSSSSTAIAAELTPPARSGGRLTLLGSLALPVAGLGFLVYGIRVGLPADSALMAVSAVALTQVLPGALLWRLIRPRHGWWVEDVAMGFAIGAVLAVAAQVLAGLTRLSWLSGGIGLAVATGLLLMPSTRARILAAETTAMPWWWGALVAAPSLVAVRLLDEYFRRMPFDWSAGARVAHQDAYHHLSLAGQLATRGPTTFPWVESEPLAYHWFTHAWVAQTSKVSGAGLDAVLFRFMPVMMPLVVVLAVAIAAVRLSGRPWTGPVAAFLLMASGNLNVFAKASPGFPTRPFSPSLPFAGPLLIATVIVLALGWRRQLHRGGVVLLPVLCIGAAGTKGSTVPLIIAGLVLAALAMLFVDRSRVGPIVLDLSIVVACLLFAFVTVFRGASAGLRIDPSTAASQTMGATWLGGVHSTEARAFVLILAVAAELTRAAGTLGLLASRRGRRDPVTWLLLGGSLAGAVAVGLLTHPGEGQDHIARSAAPLMAIGSTLGLAVVIDKLGSRARMAIPMGIIAGPLIALAPVALLGDLLPGATRHALALLACAALLLVLVGVMAAVSAPSRRRPVVASVIVVTLLAGGTTVLANALINYEPRQQPQPVDASARGAVSRDQIDAARWIRDHSDIDDLVMTNRHCVSPNPRDECDARRFTVAAFSERQVLVEGWAYTPMAVELAPVGRQSFTVDYWEPDLLALNDGFVARPTEAAARQLRELGVRWVFVDDTIVHAPTLEPFARLRFQTPRVDVYELQSTS